MKRGWKTAIALLVVSPGFSQSYEDLFRQAAAAVAQGDYRAAAARYEAALKLRPEAVEALSNLGVMYHTLGRYSDAVQVLKRAVAAQRDLGPANLILGIDLVHMNQPADAIAPLQRALAADPRNRDAALALAGARVAINDLEGASLIYRQQTDRAPGDKEAWYGLAVCYERMAEAASRQLAHIENSGAWSKRFLGEFLLARGEGRLAMEALTEAYTKDPGQPGLEKLLQFAQWRVEGRPEGEGKPPEVDWSELPSNQNTPGSVYRRARELAQLSRRAFERFVEIDPDSWQSNLFLGDVNRQRRNFPEAIQHYEAAAQKNPQTPAPFVGLGTVYWELGQFDRAEPYLREVLKRNPNSYQALFALGDIATRQQRNEEGIELLTRCIELDPERPAAHASLGRALLHAGRYAEAVTHLEVARSMDTYGDIHFQLSQALKQLGRAGESAQAMEQSARIRKEQLQREIRLRGGK